jgi:hypothetical protein
VTHDLVLLCFAIGFAFLGLAALVVPERYVEDRFLRWFTAVSAFGLALLVGVGR